jgi:NAD(P)-dependent dehydrogenase (short-subunit alcohol dehydrogenase family)
MLDKKVVIITGGLGLLGQSFAKAVLEHNGTAILADLPNPNADEIIKSLAKNSNSDNVYFYTIDITSKESVKSVVKSVHDKFEKIDSWVNNAFPRISRTSNNIKREYSSSFFDFSYEDLYESVGLNFGGTFLCSQQISKYFLDQGYGNIINISSIYGIIAPRFEIYDQTSMTMPVDYAIIKAGTIHFTKYLAKYLKGKNIRVNSLSPGGIFNNQPETFVKAYKNFSINKGMLDCNDINGALLFLLSDYSQFVNGQNLTVDDGFTI